jgi:hypothetical protein
MTTHTRPQATNIVTACVQTFLGPMREAGIDVPGLLDLQGCGFARNNLPSCAAV